MERGAKASGSRFAYLKGDLVFLQFALVQFALKKLAGKGFRPVVPPVLVRDEVHVRHRLLPHRHAAGLPRRG